MRKIEFYDGQVLRARLTTEEVGSDRYIATCWVPEECLEVDREVEAFETYSAALAEMYRSAMFVALKYTNLKMKRIDE
jgi:hypothetical protein